MSGYRGMDPTRPDIEVGGMNWQIAAGEQLPAGQVYAMECVERPEDGLVNRADKSVFKILDDESVHIVLANQVPGGEVNYADHTFPPGTLKLILDHLNHAYAASHTAETPIY